MLDGGGLLDIFGSEIAGVPTETILALTRAQVWGGGAAVGSAPGEGEPAASAGGAGVADVPVLADGHRLGHIPGAPGQDGLVAGGVEGEPGVDLRKDLLGVGRVPLHALLHLGPRPVLPFAILALAFYLCFWYTLDHQEEGGPAMEQAFLLRAYGACWGPEAGPWNLSVQNKYLEYMFARFFEEHFPRPLRSHCRRCPAVPRRPAWRRAGTLQARTRPSRRPGALLYQDGDEAKKTLENWQPTGSNPFYGSIDGRFTAPKEIHALGRVPPGSKAVVIHPKVQERMERDPAYAQEIFAKIDTWSCGPCRHVQEADALPARRHSAAGPGEGVVWGRSITGMDRIAQNLSPFPYKSQITDVERSSFQRRRGLLQIPPM